MGCVECKPKNPCREVTICECPVKDLQTDCSVYVGEELKDINVKSGTILTTVLEKISNQFKRLKEYVDKSFEVRNVGDGISLYRGNHNVDGTKEIKTLIAGEGIEIKNSFNNKEVIIKSTFEGGIEYSPGEDIKIEDNVISYDGIKYKAGDNINIDSEGVISTPSQPEPIEYTSGDNINIENNVISAIDTVYKAGNDISIGVDNSINYIGSGGGTPSIYTSSSIGDGVAVYGKTIGNNFQFRSLNTPDGSKLSITESGDTITIDTEYKGIRPSGYHFGSTPIMVKDNEDIYGEGSKKILNLMFELGLGYYIETTDRTLVVRSMVGGNTELGQVFQPADPEDPIETVIRDFDWFKNQYASLIQEAPKEVKLSLKDYGNTSNNKYDLNKDFIDTLQSKGMEKLVIEMDDTIELNLDYGTVGPVGVNIEIKGGNTKIKDFLISKEIILKDTKVSTIIGSTNRLAGERGSSIKIENSDIKGSERVIYTQGSLHILKSKINPGSEGTTIQAGSFSNVVIEDCEIARPEIILLPTATGGDINIELKGNTVTYLGEEPLIKIEGTVLDTTHMKVKTFGNNLKDAALVTSTRENIVKTSYDFYKGGQEIKIDRYNSVSEAISAIGYNKLYLDATDNIKYTGGA